MSLMIFATLSAVAFSIMLVAPALPAIFYPREGARLTGREWLAVAAFWFLGMAAILLFTVALGEVSVSLFGRWGPSLFLISAQLIGPVMGALASKLAWRLPALREAQEKLARASEITVRRRFADPALKRPPLVLR